MQIAVSEQRPQSRMAVLVRQYYWGQTLDFLNALIFPQDVDELDGDLKFSWSFLKVIDLKTEAKRQLDRVHAQLTKESRPAQVEHPQEVWLHENHTRGQRDQERQERAWNFSRQKDAAKRGEEANAYFQQAKHPIKKRRRRGQSNNTESEESTGVYSHHVLIKIFLNFESRVQSKQLSAMALIWLRKVTTFYLGLTRHQESRTRSFQDIHFLCTSAKWQKSYLRIRLKFGGCTPSLGKVDGCPGVRREVAPRTRPVWRPPMFWLILKVSLPKLHSPAVRKNLATSSWLLTQSSLLRSYWS